MPNQSELIRPILLESRSILMGYKLTFLKFIAYSDHSWECITVTLLEPYVALIITSHSLLKVVMFVANNFRSSWRSLRCCHHCLPSIYCFVPIFNNTTLLKMRNVEVYQHQFYVNFNSVARKQHNFCWTTIL